MPISLNAQGSEPFYQQIIDQVRNLIFTGRLLPGTSLPSVRSLAQELAVSVITTRRAYDELEREGFVFTRPGMGSFVADYNPAERDATRRRLVQTMLQEAVDEALRLGVKPKELLDLFVSCLNDRSNGV